MFNIEYSIDIGFGTPAQTLSLTTSLLSNITWVPSTGCDCHDSEKRFESTWSSSFIPSGNFSTHQYLIGSVTGEYVTDTITIGDLTLENERFLLVDSDKQLTDMLSDGGFGLNLSPKVNFIERLFEQQVISEPVFSFFLTNSDVFNSLTDTFTVGESDFNYYSNGNTPNLIKVFHESFWLSTIDEFSIGEKKTSGLDSWIYFEVGFLFNILPDENYKAFIAEINQNVKGCDTTDLAICKCEFGKYSQFPDLKFKIDGNEYVIHAENYIFYDTEYCYLLVLGYKDIWLAGQPFFREYYSVFNVKDRNILVAPAYREIEGFNNFYQVSAAGIYAGCVALIALGAGILRRRQEGDYIRFN
jgi:hypothetical protein